MHLNLELSEVFWLLEGKNCKRKAKNKKFDRGIIGRVFVGIIGQ